MLMEGVHNILAVSKLPHGFWAEVLSTYVYSKTSIIRTPLCYLYHKSVQINEFVWISEAHSLIYKVGVQIIEVWIIKVLLYLQNCSPTNALTGITPYEAWCGIMPDVSFSPDLWMQCICPYTKN